MNQILHDIIRKKSLSFFQYNYKKYLTTFNERIDEYDNTALFYAIKSNRVDIAKFLISQGNPVNQKNILGNSILHMLCLYSPDEIDLIEDIVNNNKEFLHSKDQSGSLPLHYAAMGNHSKLVRLLVNKNNDTIKIKDNSLSNALHVACEYAAIDVVSYLLNENKEIKPDLNGFNEHIIEIILKNKNINERELYQLLLNFPFLMKLKTYHNSNILLLFCQKNKKSMIELFLQHDISAYEPNDLNKRAIDYFQDSDFEKLKYFEQEKLSPFIHSPLEQLEIKRL